MLRDWRGQLRWPFCSDLCIELWFDTVWIGKTCCNIRLKVKEERVKLVTEGFFLSNLPINLSVFFCYFTSTIYVSFFYWWSVINTSKMQNEPFLILSPICTFSCVKNGLHSRLLCCINMLHFCFMGQCSFVGVQVNSSQVFSLVFIKIPRSLKKRERF